MGILGALLGLVVVEHVIHVMDQDEHRRLHRKGIHHHHVRVARHVGGYRTRKDGRVYRVRRR